LGADDTTCGTGTATGASMDIDSGDISPPAQPPAPRRTPAPGDRAEADAPGAARAAEAGAALEARAAAAEGSASGGDGSGGSGGGGGSGRGATHSNTGMVDAAGGGGSTKSPVEEALVRSPGLRSAWQPARLLWRGWHLGRGRLGACAGGRRGGGVGCGALQ